MKDLFYMGGPPFMGLLTLLFLAMLAWFVVQLLAIRKGDYPDAQGALRQLSYGKSIGLFAMITGILGQLIGLYQAFQAIEGAGDVSPAMVMGGLKVSMITTLYGIIIYLISLLIWFLFFFWVGKASR